MRLTYSLYFVSSIICFLSCDSGSTISSLNLNEPPCRFANHDQNVWIENGQTFLYGGDSDTMHFNITNWALNTCQLKKGIGRETFQALINSDYRTINEVINLHPDEKCLVLTHEDYTKVYPYVTLSFHEAVNEWYDHIPICIAYCKLADLAVVYNRMICNNVLTFGISGYTYADPYVSENTESFILWDRETESLWWPLLDSGVSGVFNGVLLKKFDQLNWETLKWSEVKYHYPNAFVLYSQLQDPPQDILSINPDSIDC